VRLAAGIIGQVGGGCCTSKGQNRGGERREREGEKGRDSNYIFLEFGTETWKTLNTKVIGNLKIYNFCFSQKFI
jgi:hypothetical protein